MTPTPPPTKKKRPFRFKRAERKPAAAASTSNPTASKQTKPSSSSSTALDLSTFDRSRQVRTSHTAPKKKPKKATPDGVGSSSSGKEKRKLREGSIDMLTESSDEEDDDVEVVNERRRLNAEALAARYEQTKAGPSCTFRSPSPVMETRKRTREREREEPTGKEEDREEKRGKRQKRTRSPTLTPPPDVPYVPSQPMRSFERQPSQGARVISLLDGADSRENSTPARPSPAGPRPKPKDDESPDPVLELFIHSALPGTTPIVMQRRYLQPLRDVRKAYCNRFHLDLEKTFLLFRGAKVFDMSSCKGLGVRLDYEGALASAQEGMEGAKVVFEAVTEASWELLKTGVVSDDEEEEEVQEVVVKERGVRIKLRAKGRAEVVLDRVRKADTVAALVKRYSEKAQVEARSVTLRFEGDELDPQDSVQDLDLQNDEIVDVHVA